MIHAAVTTSLSQFLTDVGEIVSNAMSWMSSAFTTISGNAVLMAIVFGLPLCTLGITLLARLIRV